MELLKKLTECAAPSGRESKLRSLIETEMHSCCDEIYTDALGNLICRKNGNGKKLMLAAHMDEIGIIVTFIDKNGFLRFSAVGGVRDYNCVNRTVIFENGTRGIISFENKNKPSGSDKMYIDIGAGSRAEAETLVSIGDTAAFVGEYAELGNRLCTKAADDRAGCYALIRAMQQGGKTDNDIYAVFTVQEELGLRGSKTAAYSIKPDMGIAIDVSSTGDTPESVELNLKLGEGPGIKIKDSSYIMHPQVRDFLIDCAKKADVPYQLEAAANGGTDAGAIQFAGCGTPSGTVSIPTRYIHSQTELIDTRDLENTVKLIKTVIETELM